RPACPPRRAIGRRRTREPRATPWTRCLFASYNHVRHREKRPGGAPTPPARRRGKWPRRSRSVPLGDRVRLPVRALLTRRCDMGKKATGQLYENRTRRGVTYGLRFRTRSGERAYETLGRSWEGMSRTDADRAAEDLLARVRLGITEHGQSAAGSVRSARQPARRSRASVRSQRTGTAGGATSAARVGTASARAAGQTFAINSTAICCRGSPAFAWTRSTSRRWSGTRRPSDGHPARRAALARPT